MVHGLNSIREILVQELRTLPALSFSIAASVVFCFFTVILKCDFSCLLANSIKIYVG